jgi:flavin-dependent dehydrogenase
MSRVLIRGGGVAALTCAHLLRRSGFRVSFEKADRPKLPAILLSDAAQHLIAGVFGREGLFDRLPPIRTRVVSWGTEPFSIPHAAVVVSEADLLNRLAGAEQDVAAPAADEPAWTIHTLTPAASHTFGSRPASVYPVDLHGDAEPCACWIESLDEGWLFLITTAPQRAWLLAVGGFTADPFAGSSLVAKKIARVGDCTGKFTAAPRIAAELCGAKWLACGSAAMAFDPLCGDGTAHAVREAILASAIVAAESRGEDTEELCTHYRARLLAGFQRHLGLCESYYRTASGKPWWKEQCRAIVEGLSWCERRGARTHRFEYRLNDFMLERV